MRITRYSISRDEWQYGGSPFPYSGPEWVMVKLSAEGITGALKHQMKLAIFFCVCLTCGIVKIQFVTRLTHRCDSSYQRAQRAWLSLLFTRVLDSKDSVGSMSGTVLAASC